MPLRIWDCEARGSDVQKTFKLHVLSDERYHSPRSLIRTALNTFTHPEEPGTVQTHSAPRVPETVHGEPHLQVHGVLSGVIGNARAFPKVNVLCPVCILDAISRDVPDTRSATFRQMMDRRTCVNDFKVVENSVGIVDNELAFDSQSILLDKTALPE